MIRQSGEVNPSFIPSQSSTRTAYPFTRFLDTSRPKRSQEEDCDSVQLGEELMTSFQIDVELQTSASQELMINR